MVNFTPFKKLVQFFFVAAFALSCSEAIDEVPSLSVPTGLEVSKGIFTDKIEITWQAVDGANSYQLFKFDSEIGDFENFKEVNQTTYTDTTKAVPGEKVYYKIRAVGAPNVVSELSASEYGFLQEIVISKLDIPLELKASQGEFGNSIRLTWIEVPLVQNYQIFKFDKATDSYLPIGESEGPEFFDTNLSGYAAYEKIFYKIRSFNSETEYSDFTSVSFGYFNGLNYQFDFEFGSQGTANGQFLFPEHVNTDQSGNIYISDPNTSRVQKFTSAGEFLEVFHRTEAPRGLIVMEDGSYLLARSSDNKISYYNASKTLISEFGGFGTENGKFHYFRQIALDDEGFLYVVDHNNHRIQKFDMQGNFVAKWGQYAEKAGNGDFNNPWGIVFYKEYLVVSSQNIIQFFTKSGEFVKEFAMESDCYDMATDSEHLYIAAGGSIIKTDESFEVLEKIGEGEFSLVSGIAIGKNDELIASSVYERKIRVYKKNP